MSAGAGGDDLRAIADQLALSRLADLYARAIDRGDSALLASLYTDDATHDYGDMYRGGLPGFLAFIAATMTAMRTHHFMGNRLYMIEGDMAEGEVYSINSHVIEGARRPARLYRRRPLPRSLPPHARGLALHPPHPRGRLDKGATARGGRGGGGNDNGREEGR